MKLREVPMPGTQSPEYDEQATMMRSWLQQGRRDPLIVFAASEEPPWSTSTDTGVYAVEPEKRILRVERAAASAPASQVDGW